MQYVDIRPQLVASRSVCKSYTYALKFEENFFAITHKKPHKWLKFFTNRTLCTGLLLQLVFLSDSFSGYWLPFKFFVGSGPGSLVILWIELVVQLILDYPFVITKMQLKPRLWKPVSTNELYFSINGTLNGMHAEMNPVNIA